MNTKISKWIPITLIVIGLVGLAAATGILPFATTSFTVEAPGIKNVEILGFTHTDINGGVINPGDVLRFTGTIKNSGTVAMYGYYAMLYAATDGQTGYIIPDTAPAALAVGATIPIDKTWTVPTLASYPGGISAQLIWVDGTSGFVYYSITDMSLDPLKESMETNLPLVGLSGLLVIVGLFMQLRKK